MLFNSIEFMVFLPMVIAAYFVLPFRYRWVLLLAASYYFYMQWRPEYIILIIVSTVIDYVAAIQLDKTEVNWKRKAYLGLSLLVNLGLLFSFKYYNFFSESVNSVLVSSGNKPMLTASSLLLPVGISFYTFQTLSYTIDIYLRRRKPERHLGIFALYVSFFPQLVAGPIERSDRLIPQFKEKHDFEWERLIYGGQLMVWGLFKKMVVADRLAVIVNQVFNNIGIYRGWPLIIGTVAFAFQIYCDFSGYSDIAIGAAKILGFDLMKNFERPYFSKSIEEFWRRWHISLSTWFRDYVYIPLGGSRVNKSRVLFNLGITFLVSGLWHGANWTFVVWGAFHGGLLVAERILKPLRMWVHEKCEGKWWSFVYDIFRVVKTFSLVCIGWVFFRANSMADALYALNHFWRDLGTNANYKLLEANLGAQGFGVTSIRISVGVLLFLLTIQWFQRRGSFRLQLKESPLPVRWAVWYSVAFLILLFGVTENVEFIYFQF